MLPRSHERKRNRRRPTRRLTAVPTLAGLLLAALSIPAWADGAGATSAPVDAMTAAQAQADASGTSVPVDSLTTETYTVTANPDGSFTAATSLLPVRVKQNGGWVPVDSDLAAGPGGTYSPKATPNQVTLSGGGSSPLVVLSRPDGQKLSFSVPFTLPAPQVTGDTALYPAVLPGVDLRATITDQGGFSEVLIVHDAQAAANPDLKKLTLAATTQGLHLAANATGGMDATATDGTTAYSSPAPIMWDSSTDADADTPAPSATPSASSTTAHTATQAAFVTQADDSTTPDPASEGVTESTAAGPGTGAQISPVAMTTTAGGLTITPDASALTGPGVDYPLYIDPSVFPSGDPSMASSHYDEVYSSSTCDDAPQYDKPQTSGEGVGYQQWGGSCGVGLERSYYAISTSQMDPSWVVNTATLSVADTYAASYNCSEDQTVTLHSTGTINSGTDWNNKPGTSDSDYPAVSTTVASGSNPNSSCSNKTADFSVKSQAQKVADNNLTSWTFGLFGNESQTSGNVDYLRFSSKLTLTVTFDVKPTVSNLHSVPTPVNPSGCTSKTTPGWLGATTSSGSSSNITLHATVNTYITGEQAKATFNVYDNDTANSSGGATLDDSPTTGSTASGTDASALIGTVVKDGHLYDYTVQAKNVSTQALTSAVSAPCYFAVDATPPATATIDDNTSFPRVGDGSPDPVVYAGTGTTSTFTVHAADGAPADTCTVTGSTCRASGVDHFIWALDRQPTIADNDGSVDPTTAVTGTATATASIPVPIADWGVHNLYVAAVDKANNPSQVAGSYTFTAPWNPSTKVAPGDLTGDGVPDLTATTKTGDLELIPGDTDGSQSVQSSTQGYTGPGSYTGPVLVSTAADAPAGTGDSWSNYAVTHRGNMFGQQVDDLFALNTKSTPHTLYVVKNDLDPNPGGVQPTTAGFTLNRNLPLGKPSTGCQPLIPAARCSGVSGYDATDWNKATQIIAPGDVYGAGEPDLITVENNQLWIYQGLSGGSLTDPVLLGDGDWSGFTLIAPGAVSGSPTIWARENISGNVYTYSIKPDATTGLPPLLHAPVRTALVSGIANGTGGGTLCVDDLHSGTAPGNVVDVYGCNSTGAQNWTLRDDGTVRVLGECLDTAGNAVALKTLVVIDDCNSAQTTQKWTLGPTGSLLNTAADLCLDDPTSSNVAGTQLQIYTCNSTAAQNWQSATGGVWPTPNNQTQLGLHIPASNYPQVASPGDVNSADGGGPDGNPDLYMVDTAGTLLEHFSVAPSGNYANFGGTLALGAITDTATHVWSLGDGSGTTATDTVGGLNATLTGGATWSTGTGRPGSVLGLDGSTGYAETSGPAVDTSGSYSVSAWVKLGSLAVNSTFVSQSDDPSVATSNSLQLYYSSGAKHWAFNRCDNDAGCASFTAAYGGTPVLNTWTHLVGVFDADARTVTLYVNGHLAATTAYAGTLWNATGPVEIGRRISSGTYGEYANGSVSDVHMYSTALPPADAALTDDLTTITGIS